MYYRGDEFGSNPQVVEPIYDAGFVEPIQLYANSPDSDIRKLELEAGQRVADSGFTGGGGFLNQLGEVASTFGLFFSPFLPVLGPALMSTPLVGGAIKTAQKLATMGGALRPTIEAITTGPAATTTGRGATSVPPSEISPASPKTFSPAQPPLSGTYYPPAGPQAGPEQWARRLPARRAPARPRSRGTRASPRLSPAQRGVLSAEVRRLLQQ